MRVGIQPFPASGHLRLDFRFAKMRTTATSCRVLNPGIASAKTKGHRQVSFCFGGSEGIRTPEPVKTTRFPIVPVMTTSIRFLISARLFASVFYILYFFERFVKYFIGLFSINLLFENRTIVFKQRAQIIGGDELPNNYSTVFL